MIDEFVMLEHGNGSKKSEELIGLIVQRLGETYMGIMEDSATLPCTGHQMALTTDSFVLNPLFFVDGNIGKVAVCGTVNDLAVMGATPRYLTLALIIEAGMKISDLLKVIDAIRDTALTARVKIVAGDTKVVNRGEVDKLFINTTGLGEYYRLPLSMSSVKERDVIIVTGQLGNHSIHILSLREGLGFETVVKSDCAPLNHLIEAMLNSPMGEAVRSIRDITRGGLAQVLHEYAGRVEKNILIEDDQLPLQHETKMACDMLGIDFLNLANEGCLCLFVDPDYAEAILHLLRQYPEAKHAAMVGRITENEGRSVLRLKADGSLMEIAQLQGMDLPRLC